MTKLNKTTSKRILLGRLRAARKDAGLNQTQFAEMLGISRDRYSKYEIRSVIPTDLAVLAAPILKKPFEYFVSAESVNEDLPIFGDTASLPLTGTVPVTVVGAVQAGMFREALEWPPEQQERLAIPVDVPYSDKPLRGLKVVGPSMNKWYPDGSYVVILPTVYLSQGWLPSTGQHVVVQRQNGFGESEATVKEVAYDGDDVLLWPRSDHPDFQKPWRITAPAVTPMDDDEPLRITGLVVWAMRAAPGV